MGCSVYDEWRELDRGETLSLKTDEKLGFTSKEKQRRRSFFGPQFTEHCTFGICLHPVYEHDT